jgi:uncharacterized protein (UPF0276 family)
VGHGVFFSLFSGRWLPEQADWLQNLRNLRNDFHFSHVTEHFGYMTGADFHTGAPLSLPFTDRTLHIGRDRLARICDAAQCPIGLENLAFAYSLDDVMRQGVFLEALLEPLNGFIILDLHNLYCQLHNFELDALTLLQHYPLHRVREIHISGGSWDTTLPDRKIRRDTHDDAVPSTVFELLRLAMPLCPNLRFVVMEQLGTALYSDAEKQQFRQDFLTMRDLVAEHRIDNQMAEINNFVPPNFILDASPAQDETLYLQQRELAHILETASSHKEAQQMLATSALSGTAWSPHLWQEDMLQTAMKIAQKWKNGFAAATKK